MMPHQFREQHSTRIVLIQSTFYSFVRPSSQILNTYTFLIIFIILSYKNKTKIWNSCMELSFSCNFKFTKKTCPKKNRFKKKNCEQKTSLCIFKCSEWKEMDPKYIFKVSMVNEKTWCRQIKEKLFIYLIKIYIFLSISHLALNGIVFHHCLSN